tara:strand:- start:2135 stop:4399 length:2265 start_codon:yes stop_codon:yes gene_type:complete
MRHAGRVCTPKFTLADESGKPRAQDLSLQRSGDGVTQTENSGPDGSIAQLLARAKQQRLSDQFDAARLTCHEIFQLDPVNASAMCVLGICDLESGQRDSGREWLDKAQAASPDLPLLHLYRSVEWEMAGDPVRALGAARRAAELDPASFDAWGRLGDLAGRSNDFALAAEAMQRALEVDPTHPARPHIALRLAGAQVECGNPAGALAALAIAEQGGLAGHADVLRLRAALARQDGDWKAMVAIAEAWAAAAPDDLEAISAHALALGQMGYYARAAEIYRAVVNAEPEIAGHWAALGRLVLGTRDLPAATDMFRAALDIDADCADATFGLARVHTFTGRLDQAELMCRRTLEIKPDHLEAYGQLCEVTGGKLTDAEVERLTAAVAVPGLPADTLAIGLFALGDAHHHRKQPEEAFAAWARANATKKIQHGHSHTGGYDRAAQEERVSRLIAMFATETPVPTLPEAGGPRPIFIVGMPRSGTTLIEAAISAHEDVAAGGELSAMPYIMEEFWSWADRTGWAGGEIPQAQRLAWRARYLSHYASFGLEKAKFVTDKQPSNFLAAGLIRQIFPEAAIIHIRRRPVETAFSIYRRNFSRQWPFAHDLDDIAHYYAQHSRLGAHWEAAFGRRYTPLQYESLVADFERELRFIIARIGLGWSRNCLDFHLQERSVLTFSSVQVRKPASAAHLDTSAPYMAFLGELDARIESLGVDPQTGAWLEIGGADTARSTGRSANQGQRSGKGGFLSGLFGRKADRSE